MIGRKKNKNFAFVMISAIAFLISFVLGIFLPKMFSVGVVDVAEIWNPASKVFINSTLTQLLEASYRTNDVVTVTMGGFKWMVTEADPQKGTLTMIMLPQQSTLAVRDPRLSTAYEQQFIKNGNIMPHGQVDDAIFEHTENITADTVPYKYVSNNSDGVTMATDTGYGGVEYYRSIYSNYCELTNTGIMLAVEPHEKRSFPAGYPTYGSSFYRAVALNNGGVYNELLGLSSATTLTNEYCSVNNAFTYFPQEDHPFAQFTVDGFGLTDYILSPAEAYGMGIGSLRLDVNGRLDMLYSKIGSAQYFNDNPLDERAILMEQTWVYDYLWIPSLTQMNRWGIVGGDRASTFFNITTSGIPNAKSLGTYHQEVAVMTRSYPSYDGRIAEKANYVAVNQGGAVKCSGFNDSYDVDAAFIMCPALCLDAKKAMMSSFNDDIGNISVNKPNSVKALINRITGGKFQPSYTGNDGNAYTMRGLDTLYWAVKESFEKYGDKRIAPRQYGRDEPLTGQRANVANGIYNAEVFRSDFIAKIYEYGNYVDDTAFGNIAERAQTYEKLFDSEAPHDLETYLNSNQLPNFDIHLSINGIVYSVAQVFYAGKTKSQIENSDLYMILLMESYQPSFNENKVVADDFYTYRNHLLMDISNSNDFQASQLDLDVLEDFFHISSSTPGLTAQGQMRDLGVGSGTQDRGSDESMFGHPDFSSGEDIKPGTYLDLPYVGDLGYDEAYMQIVPFEVPQDEQYGKTPYVYGANQYKSGDRYFCNDTLYAKNSIYRSLWEPRVNYNRQDPDQSSFRSTYSNNWYQGFWGISALEQSGGYQTLLDSYGAPVSRVLSGEFVMANTPNNANCLSGNGYFINGKSANFVRPNVYTEEPVLIRPYLILDLTRLAALTEFPKSTTISLDKQGGNGGSNTATVVPGERMSKITPPTRSGYIFQGYFTSQNGAGTKYFNADGTSALSVCPSSPVSKLYASWKEDTWIEHRSSSYASGSGSQTSPYMIRTAAQLAYLAYNVNNTASYMQGKFFKLGADINLAAYPWVPIGTGSSSDNKIFKANFDGGGYTISNMTTTSTSIAAGLFGTVSGADIHDIVLENINVGNVGTAGGVVGIAYESGIYFVKVLGGTITTTSSYSQGGGILGRAASSCSIYGCSNTATISSWIAGGIYGGISSGHSSCDITNCHNLGNIDGSLMVGGIAGETGSLISHCTSKADISGTNYCGTIVGSGATVEYCASWGSLSPGATSQIIVATATAVNYCSFFGTTTKSLTSGPTGTGNIVSCGTFKKYSSAGVTTEKWAIVPGFNDGLPLQRDLFDIAAGAPVDNDFISKLTALGFKSS